MKKLKVKFANCYGIEKLKKEFNFENSKTQLIYAKNGSMKTSFAKIFEKFQLGKESDIKDLIHNNEPVEKEIKIIEENGDNEEERDIKKEEIFVIKSFIPSFESEKVATLLVDNDLKGDIENIFKLKNDFLKLLENQSGLKISKTSGGKKIFELEPQLLKDFDIQNESFLKKLDVFSSDDYLDRYKNIKYSTIFDALNIIQEDAFQNNIEAFLTKSDEIYDNYTFLSKGEFTLAKLKKIQGELKKQSFFVNDNKIKFGDDEISETDLKKKIKEIETALQDTDEFKALEKLLQKPKGSPLKDLIENNTFIVEDLKTENLDSLKKKLWNAYFKEKEKTFNELKTKFSEIKTEINNLNVDDTRWKEVIKLFNDRFFLPFKMDISNLESSVMGENLPKVVFKFPKDGDFENNDDDNWTELNREQLEKEDTLSQGEKRALYLLNIIFEIEARKGDENQKTLFIVDDIADSFDYKNKYAIVQYLKDLSQEENFYSIILTHNFDFFRTVQERIINNKWENSFIVQITNSEVNLEKAGSKNIVNPFAEWKDNLNSDFKALIPAIPFIRNLIEFKDGSKTKEYLTLTYVLHYKNNDKLDASQNVLSKKTEDILVSDLEEIFKTALNNVNFSYSEDDKNKKVIDVIYNTAEILLSENNLGIDIGNKIIFAIACRLKSEKYMWDNISNKSEIKGNQTGKLFQRFKDEFIDSEDKESQLKVLESVNIMTPENIHLNSFMYEPILDMDIVELKKLYEKVKHL